METSGAQTWLSLLGAGSVGGFLGDWLLKRGEGRTARGNVRAALADVVGDVWVELTEEKSTQWAALRRSLRNFQTAAFIARVPRPITEVFTRFVVAAWRYQYDRADDGFEYEGAPGMDSEVYGLFTDAISLVVDYLHQPIRRRHRAQRDAERIAARAADVGGDDRHWRRAWSGTERSTVY